jgi:hypothetical protein
MRRARLLKEVPTTDGRILEFEVYYDIGGMNYLIGESLRRGIYFSVTPVKKSGSFKAITLFAGTAQLLKETKRFSQKELDTITVPETIERSVLAHVLAKNDLTITS